MKTKTIPVILLISIFFLIGCAQQQDNPAVNTITIKNFAFNPQILTVKIGTTLTWINEDIAPHTVTSENLFNSGTKIKGQSFSYTFEKTGTFEYICTIHPDMKAKVIVEE